MRQITEHTSFAFPDAMKEIEELQARLKWQPIETAPKDGSRILLAGKYSIAIGAWGGTRPACWKENVSNGRSLYGTTHWMPLPELPLTEV